jgi:hypothetical protein
MKKYTNCVGASIKILFESNIITYLAQSETSIDFPVVIVSVEKYSLFSTLKDDTIRWISINFEVDRNNCIREKPRRRVVSY